MNFRCSKHASGKRRVVVCRVISWKVCSRLQRRKCLDTLGILCCQSVVEIGRKPYLVRVMVNETASPPTVVTVYRTSKIEKYWRTT